MSTASRRATEFTTLDITMAQAKLLYVLMAVGELSMSEIAKQLGCGWTNHESGRLASAA